MNKFAKYDVNKSETECTNCGQVPQRKIVKGLCPACRIFFRRNGRHRTEADMIRWRGDDAPLCSNCNQNRAVQYRGLCSACYQYKKLNGVDRPSHRWREECKICGKPRGKGFVKGRCQICYSYRRKFGKDRRHRIEELYPFGWCDCGRPATQTKKISVPVGNHQRSEVLSLCDVCAEFENEIRSFAIGD